MSIYQNYYLDKRESRHQKIREEEREKYQKELDRLRENQDRFEREIKNELSYMKWPARLIEETINKAKQRVNKKRKDDE